MESCKLTYKELLELVDRELQKAGHRDKELSNFDETPNVPGGFLFNFPAYRNSANLSSEVAHLVEETAEFNSAVYEYMSDEDIICELMDVIHTAETIMRIVGNRNLVDNCKSLVIEKNRRRGYYVSQD